VRVPSVIIEGTGTAVGRRTAVAAAALVVLLGACTSKGTESQSATASPPASSRPTPSPTPTLGPIDPGTLPQTNAVPSDQSVAFQARMAYLWKGMVNDSLPAAMHAFFPRSAYVQIKAINDPGADFQNRLVSAYRLDLGAVHDLLGPDAPTAKLVSVSVPKQWTWIPPGGCYNTVGYWHAPGARLVYKVGNQIRSFGVFSFISWRGEWYIVHLSSYDKPGTVDSPAIGRGSYGPAGGC
jgi:hypothetical protein